LHLRETFETAWKLLKLTVAGNLLFQAYNKIVFSGYELGPVLN